MPYYIIKIIISAILIFFISEIGKRNSFVGGLLASIPMISLLAFCWIYIDTKESSKIIDLSCELFQLQLYDIVTKY